MRHGKTAREGHGPAARAATHPWRALTFVRAWDFPQRPQQVRGAEGGGTAAPLPCALALLPGRSVVRCEVPIPRDTEGAGSPQGGCRH